MFLIKFGKILAVISSVNIWLGSAPALLPRLQMHACSSEAVPEGRPALLVLITSIFLSVLQIES